MSAQSSAATGKGMVLRLIVPAQVNSNKLVEQLGPSQRIESETIILDSGRLTTDEIAKSIRELTKLRDESLHTIRLLTAERHPKNIPDISAQRAKRIEEYWGELEQIRNEYRDVQSTNESLEKQVEDSKKRITLLRQLDETGFDIEDVKSNKGFGFTRILGRVPTRRLQDARKALESSFKDQAIMATGNQKGDWTYTIIAVHTDKANSALQTLVLHDFTSLETPDNEEPDIKTALKVESGRLESLTKDLEESRAKMSSFVKDASERLNSLLDNAQESLIYLRAVLRMGEGAKAQHAFTILTKNPPAKALDTLSKSGAVVELD